ncbi:MAG: hypothetical protein Q4E61_03700 [Alphaproteobacteria bacterium]|nr:hypothetical protein [Alphaproteobacteria bacterium]
MIKFIIGFIFAIAIMPIIENIVDLFHAILEVLKSYCGVVIATNNDKIAKINQPPNEERKIIPGFGAREEDNNDNL